MNPVHPQMLLAFSDAGYVVSQWCSGGVVVVSRWCFGRVPALSRMCFRWCFGGVPVASPLRLCALLLLRRMCCWLGFAGPSYVVAAGPWGIARFVGRARHTIPVS